MTKLAPPSEAELLAQKKDKFLKNIGLEDKCISCNKKSPMVGHNLSPDRSSIEVWYRCDTCGYKQGMRITGNGAKTYDALFKQIDETARGARAEDTPLS